MGQISSNLLTKAFATWQHAFLSTSIAFYDIFAQACAEIKILRKWPTSLGFSIFQIFFARFLFLLFFSFCCSDWPSTGLASSLKILRKHHRDGQFLLWKPRVMAGNFALSFSLNFLSIFVHISGSIGPITLIWVSLEKSFPPAEVEHRWCQFWSKVMMSEVEERPKLVTVGWVKQQQNNFSLYLFIYWSE